MLGLKLNHVSKGVPGNKTATPMWPDPKVVKRNLGLLSQTSINFNLGIDKCYHMPTKVWDEITQLSPNFNAAPLDFENG